MKMITREQTPYISPSEVSNGYVIGELIDLAVDLANENGDNDVLDEIKKILTSNNIDYK